MYGIKYMGEFGFTQTHVSLKPSPSASFVEQFCLKQMIESDLPKTTFTIDFLHTLLQWLRLAVQSAVENTTKDTNANTIF